MIHLELALLCEIPHTYLHFVSFLLSGILPAWSCKVNMPIFTGDLHPNSSWSPTPIGTSPATSKKPNYQTWSLCAELGNFFCQATVRWSTTCTLHTALLYAVSTFSIIGFRWPNDGQLRTNARNTYHKKFTKNGPVLRELLLFFLFSYSAP
jgi:hypothetical protein